jgi:mRNA interferase MazF
MVKNIPQRGDIIVCNFSPTSGHEQKVNRPALVISGKEFNESGLAIVCPVTSKEKKYYFEVPFTTKKTRGIVLSHQVRTVDYLSRKAKIVDKIGEEKCREVIEKIKKIIEA